MFGDLLQRISQFSLNNTSYGMSTAWKSGLCLPLWKMFRFLKFFLFTVILFNQHPPSYEYALISFVFPDFREHNNDFCLCMRYFLLYLKYFKDMYSDFMDSRFTFHFSLSHAGILTSALFMNLNYFCIYYYICNCLILKILIAKIVYDNRLIRHTPRQTNHF